MTALDRARLDLQVALASGSHSRVAHLMNVVARLEKANRTAK